MPLLLLLVLGIIQFGLAYNNYLALTDAVRSGARVGVISASSTDPVTATKDAVTAAAGDLDTSKIRVTVSSTWASGSAVTVKATYPYSINIMGLVVKSGYMSSTTTARVE